MVYSSSTPDRNISHPPKSSSLFFKYTPGKKSKLNVKKTISSAIANAENNYQYDIDKLIVKEAYCGKKIIMKRFRPRAKGRAAPILKPYSSVTIILSEQQKMESHGSKG